MSRNLFPSFFFFSFATLCALQLQILPLLDAAAVQPEVQPARRTMPCTKKKKAFRVLAPRRSLTGPSASHPIHQSRCSIPPPPHLCFLAAVTHPGLALPRQPPPSSLPPSPLWTDRVAHRGEQPVVKSRVLVKKRRGLRCKEYLPGEEGNQRHAAFK